MGWEALLLVPARTPPAQGVSGREGPQVVTPCFPEQTRPWDTSHHGAQSSNHPGDPLCPASSLLTLFLSEKTSIIPENPDLENE